MPVRNRAATPEQIGAAARTTSLVRAAVDALAAHGVPAVPLGDQVRRDGEVSVATMHRMKGLEFRCIAVVGVGEGRFRTPRP